MYNTHVNKNSVSSQRERSGCAMVGISYKLTIVNRAWLTYIYIIDTTMIIKRLLFINIIRKIKITTPLNQYLIQQYNFV